MEKWREDLYTNYLAHSGTKGMHWGQRLYQYADGSLTPLGKIRYRKNKNSTKRSESNSGIESNKMTEEERKQQRSNAIKSGDISYFKKNKSSFSDEEVEALIKRIELNRKAESLEIKPEKVNKIDKLANKIGTMKNMTKTGIEAYNMLAGTYNAINQSKGDKATKDAKGNIKKMPTISLPKDNGNKDNMISYETAYKDLFKAFDKIPSAGNGGNNNQDNNKNKNKNNNESNDSRIIGDKFSNNSKLNVNVKKVVFK